LPTYPYLDLSKQYDVTLIVAKNEISASSVCNILILYNKKAL